MSDNVTIDGNTVSNPNPTLRQQVTNMEQIEPAEQARLMLLILDDML